MLFWTARILRAHERLWRAALPARTIALSAVALVGSGVRRGSALRQARRFFFWSTHKFPTRQRAIPWEISLRNGKGRESGARSALIMGNGRRFEARNSGFS